MTIGNYEIAPNAEYGFYQVSPTPTPEKITEYYANEFYSKAYPQLNNSSLEVQERDKEYNDAHREEIYQTLIELLRFPLDKAVSSKNDASLHNDSSSSSQYSLLDFGCGWGHTLQFFQNKGFDCYGCDPAPEAIEHGKQQGLKVVQNGMSSLRVFGEQRFDVVLMLNVLEHLANPAGVLQEIKQHLLKPNGILVIEVPNDFNVLQECAVKALNLPQWWIAAPAHLNYFSKATLSNLLQGQGFVIERLLGTFPLELFLLFGDNYIGNPQVGRQCHDRRVNFEMTMKKHGYEETLKNLYTALGSVGLGRQILTYARGA